MKHNVKKSLSFLLVALAMMTALVIQPIYAKAAETLDVQAESAIVVDADTGKIVFAKKPDTALPPASMTKMMTEYLVWEAVESGQISWDTTTQISDYPYSISADNSFSGVGLTENKDYTVKQLYDAMAINSDNATAIALAELIAGSEGKFVKMMNEKAEEMGLPDYKFVNSTGLSNSSLGDNYPKGTEPDANNMLSARSAALLAYRLIKDHPKALDVSKIASAEFDGQTIRNWNWMLKHDPKKASSLQQFYYEGTDGLKTGYTDLAKYCFTGTAKQNGSRYISVVMRTESKEERFRQTAKLMDYAFNNFKQVELFAQGYQLDGQSTLPVAKGKEDNVEIATKVAFELPVKNGQEEKYSIKYNINKGKLNEEGKLTAPIKKGEKVGTAELVFDGNTDYGYISDEPGKSAVNLLAQDSVEKDNWFMLTLGAIGDFFANVYHTVVNTVKGWF